MNRGASIVALWAALAVAAGAPAGDLRALVGEAEYQAMGLDKLTPDEQARLQRWLERREHGRPVPLAAPTVAFAVDGATVTATVATKAAGETTPAAAPAVVPSAAPVVPAAAPSAPERTRIGTVQSFGLDQDTVDGEISGFTARIVGEFTGWDGKTQFVLDNGQVWRQSTPGRYRWKATDPEVTIERSMIGYKLRLTETKRSINVRRIK